MLPVIRNNLMLVQDIHTALIRKVMQKIYTQLTLFLRLADKKLYCYMKVTYKI